MQLWSEMYKIVKEEKKLILCAEQLNVIVPVVFYDTSPNVQLVMTIFGGLRLQLHWNRPVNIVLENSHFCFYYWKLYTNDPWELQLKNDWFAV